VNFFARHIAAALGENSRSCISEEMLLICGSSSPRVWHQRPSLKRRQIPALVANDATARTEE